MDFKLVLLGCMVFLALSLQSGEAAPAPEDKPMGGFMAMPPVKPKRAFRPICRKGQEQECKERKAADEKAYDMKRLADLQEWVDRMGEKDWRKAFKATAKEYDALKEKHSS